MRFELALSHAPTTLNSHSSVFSGLDPHGHRVVRNGFPVPDDVPLLTERLADAGWDTLAAIGASALEPAMGLNRGFRLYDAELGREVGPRHEAPADDVTRRALALVDEHRAGQPLFLFVHYYDPHAPWDSASDEVRARFIDPDYRGPADAGPGSVSALQRKMRSKGLDDADRAQVRALYLAEVAYADQELGRLMQGLTDRGLMQDALVIAFADHGESLGEATASAPFGHGPDVDMPEIHVPLIFAGAGRFALPQGQVVPDQVRLMDLGATLLGQAGLPATLGQGEDLSGLWRGEAREAPPSFAEATKPSKGNPDKRWNNLDNERSVATGGLLLVKAPWRDAGAQLFRLTPDQPKLRSDLVNRARLSGLLSAWDSRAPGRREVQMSTETEAALKALGYVE